jgi:DNA-binding transcriptional LysR family regulator
MGVWPGLDERPEIAYTARDWLAKLHLVAAGFGLTTVPSTLAPAAPPGVRILPVRGGPQEQRRLLLARLPHPPARPVIRVAAAVRAATLDADAPDPSL